MTSFIDGAGWDRMVPYVQLEAQNEFIIISHGVASHITDAEIAAVRAVRLTDEQLVSIFELAQEGR